MRVVPIPVLADNYAYLVIDEASASAAVVDPSEDGPVRAAAEREGVRITEIWATHHHFDHVGGVPALCDALPIERVVGGAYDLAHARIPRQTHAVTETDAWSFGGRPVRTLEIPGHTLGAIAYLVEGALFSGDTLFVAGCGRVFEGTMAMMAASLGKLRALPDDTRVYCGHEYTRSNLAFAATVEPGSAVIAAAAASAQAARERAEPTVPSTIADERAHNPFFRFDVPEVARGREPVASFTALRQAKDAFRTPF